MNDALHARWGFASLQERLQRTEPGLRVEVVASISSTNSALLERAALSRAHRGNDADLAPFTPCLLVAEHQTQGRGRMGRTWHAQPGGSLTFSLALQLAPQDWSGLSLAVGVALAEALDPGRTSAPHGQDQAPRIGLKWPNDLWLRDEAAPGGGRKLGGVLIETATWSPPTDLAPYAASGPAESARVCVIGVGLNVQPQAVEAASSGVACLQELHPGAQAPQVLGWVAPALVAGVRRFEREGFAGVLEAFAHRDLLHGRAVSTTLSGLLEGTAQGVDARGALRVRAADDRLHTVGSGEVSIRPLPGRRQASPGLPAPAREARPGMERNLAVGAGGDP